jgi:hypothetical protein
VRIPIKATAHEPIKQAGYISATSDTVQIPSCEKQPVHTSGSIGDVRQVFANVCCSFVSGHAFEILLGKKLFTGE